MVKTKPVDQVVSKWKARIPGVAKSYQDGIKVAKDWQAGSLAAEPLYVEQVTAAANEGRRAAGIQKVSNAEWAKQALDKGAARIGSGMTAAIPKFSTGIAKVLSAIEGVSLPARVASGRENVINRVIPIVEALEKIKGQ